jgi:hypothetical protein
MKGYPGRDERASREEAPDPTDHDAQEPWEIGRGPAVRGERDVAPTVPRRGLSLWHTQETEIDPGITPLVEALNLVGAATEASCEGHLKRLSNGERCRPCLPYVVFRGDGRVVSFVLEVARELYYRPPEDGFLHGLWYVESCPAAEGGVFHTLTLHPSFAPKGIGKPELDAAQQDAHTFALFLLKRHRATARHGWRGLAPVTR